MAAGVKFYDFVESLGLKEHNLNTDTLNLYLSNTAPSQSLDIDKTDLAEIATGNGYTGPVDTTNTWSESGGTATLACTDVVITASGGAISQFRYVPVYNDTHTTDALLWYHDYGSALDVANGETFTWDVGASSATLV